MNMQEDSSAGEAGCCRMRRVCLQEEKVIPGGPMDTVLSSVLLNYSS